MSDKPNHRVKGYPFYIPKPVIKKDEKEIGPYEILERKFSQIYSYIKEWDTKKLEELILYLIRRIKKMVIKKELSMEEKDDDPFVRNSDIPIFIKGWEVEELEELISFIIKRMEKTIKDGYKKIISIYVNKIKEMKKAEMEKLKDAERTPINDSSIRYGVYKQD